MKNWKNICKRGISLAMALVMCLTLLPVSVFAAPVETHDHTTLAAAPETCGHSNTSKQFDSLGVFVTWYFETCKDCDQTRWVAKGWFTGNWYEGSWGSDQKPDVDEKCDHKNTEVRGAKTATCTEEGYTGDTYCQGCNTKLADGEVIPTTSHQWNEATIPATCTDKGEKSRTCTLCGETETEEIAIDANAHVWGDWQKVAEGQFARTCKLNTRHVETWNTPGAPDHTCNTNGHVDAVKPTCINTGVKGGDYCTFCGKGKDDASTVIEATGHQNTEVRDEVDVTCEKDGYTGDTWCTDCGTMIEQGEVILATDHAYTTSDPGREDYCAHAVFSQTWECTNCGDSYTAEGMTGGTKSYTLTHTEANEPTCAKDGNIEYWTCSECGKRFSDAACTVEISDVTDPATGEHEYGDPVYSFKLNPGNKSNGKLTVTKTCKVCGDVVTEEKNAQYFAPTCTAEGYYQVRSSGIPTIGGSRYERIPSGEPATGHSAPTGNWSNVYKAGYVGKHYETCTHYNKNTNRVCGTVIASEDHTWGDTVYVGTGVWPNGNNWAPTCTEPGYTTHYCTVCGKDDGRHVRVEPLGHAYEWTVTVAPTADTEGEAYGVCANDPTHTLTVTLPALGGEDTGNEWTYEVTTAPTCTEDGEGTYTYEDGSTVTVTIPATGHEWGAWVVAYEPSYTAQGAETRTCVHGCGASETRPIAALELPEGGFGDTGDTGETEIEIEDEETPLADMPYSLNPEDELTRGHLMYILHWFEGSPEAEISTFIDVAFEAYYSTAIGWAEDGNIARGTPDNKFLPDDTVTRGQMEIFLARYVEYLGLDMEVVLVGDDSDLMFWAEAEVILNEFFASLPVEA